MARSIHVLLVLTLILMPASALTYPAQAANLTADALTKSPGLDVPTGRVVSGTVWYQGFLADSGSGDPINGTVDIVAELFNQAADGTSLWGPETHSSIPVAEGWFHIELGSIDSPLPDFADPPYYLQLTINGEPFDVRQKLASVPSAIRAGDVDGGGGGGISGGGDAGYIPVFTSGAAIGNSALLETSGRLSLGTATSDAKLRVENAGGLPVLKLVNTSSGSGFDVLQIQRTQAIAADDALIQMTSATGTDTEALFIECLNSDPSLPAKPFVVRADGSIDAAGPLTIDTDGGMGLSILAQTTGHNDYCLSVGAMATGVNCIAVNGYAAESDAYGIGGWFSGGQTGVKGDVFPTGSSSYFGVSGRCNGGSGTNTAVYGEADGSGTCYGVYGVALGNGISWAGFFSGDVRVTGAINPTLGGFQIDHPLDPANRYLNHSFVESPDMKTVYDGVAVLDASGQATVVLPDYFEALNSELRYQLTPVGGAAPSLHIAEKVAGGRFVIAGGVPGLEVCWQVTGVRRDEAAEAYRIDVEELKLEQERGKYVHPELYGAPEDARIGRIPDTDKTGSE